jgi:hypothetical protein
MQEPGAVPSAAGEHFDEEPPVEGRVIADRDARPVRAAAVGCDAFAVAGQRAEGARGAFDDVTGERVTARPGTVGVPVAPACVAAGPMTRRSLRLRERRQA